MTQPIPDRDTLRALYDDTVSVIAASRPQINLQAGFYAATGDSVFEAGYISLCDHANNVRRLNVVSAPSGGGKTSFSFAFMVALTRYAEDHADSPAGCVFVVDQIKKADDCYRELHALLPGKVAIWTWEHRRGATDRTRVPNPAAEFDSDELRNFPVVVVTHKFFSGPQGDKASFWGSDFFNQQRRAIAIIDERPEEVEIYETTMREAHTVKEALAEKASEPGKHVDFLLTLMQHTELSSRNRIVKADGSVASELAWFTGEEADRVAMAHGSIVGLNHLFKFARSMTMGCAFAVSEGSAASFVGWQAKLVVRPGTMLLDATADIDGVSQICPWRKHVKTAPANYRNLSIVHVPQHTKRNLREHFKKVANRQQYSEGMAETIRAHMAPGERGLVVCKKTLFDNQQVPNWGVGDPRFADPASYGERYEWDIDGRRLCAVHWGVGIGANSWRDADVVFLFDEFFLPKRIAVATAQALLGHRADQGALAAMTTLRSRSAAVDLISNGHRLRWTKQLALRGRGRRYDESGVCGKQRLVVACDARSFLPNVRRLFPGAMVAMAQAAKQSASKTTKAAHVIQMFSRSDLPARLSTADVGNLIGIPWRKVSGNILTPELTTSLAAIGWRYISGRGRGGSYFERTAPAKLVA
ncbi:MAG: hypothetical protein WA268_20010 [Xanthobacteraceae bacterium]